MANSKYGYGRGVGEPICGSKFRLSRPVWKAVIIAALVMSIMLFWQPRHPHIGEIPNLPTQTPLSNPKRPRIAIATFVTGQHSYIYLSLKNKYRWFPFPHTLNHEILYCGLVLITVLKITQTAMVTT